MKRKRLRNLITTIGYLILGYILYLGFITMMTGVLPKNELFLYLAFLGLTLLLTLIALLLLFIICIIILLIVALVYFVFQIEEE